MAKRNDAWGIEVGANAIKAIRLVRKGTDVSIADYDVLQFKKILTTPDLNVNEAIQVNLDQFLSRHKIAGSTVMVSVPGHMAFARFAKLPPVDPKRIPDIVRFEAVQQIPFPIEQVEWDYQVFSQLDSPDVEVGIFAITKDRVNDFLENYNAVGLSVDGLTLSPLAVYNGLAYDLGLDDASPGVIFMDIGATSTDVVIVEEGRLWLRTLPIGGNNFTDALVRAFKLSFPKAEKLKREAGTSKYARQIFQAMRPVFADLVQEMQRSLGFYQSLNRDAKLTRLVGVGSTFRLPGMTKFLKQQLQLEVIRLDSFKRVKIDPKREAEFAEHSMNMATAYGLALQGLGLEAVNANLLPNDILRKRFWRAKQPWFAAAAMAMVAATGFAMGKVYAYENSWRSLSAKNDTQITDVSGRARMLIGKWNEIQTASDPRQQIENLRRTLDYRDIWPKLMWDLNQAARALETQSALNVPNPDYAEIMKIPRAERRQLIVSRVSATYNFQHAGASAAVAAGAPVAALSMDDIWGAMGDGNDGGMPTMPVTPSPMPGGEIQVSSAPPRFTIVLEGISPYPDVARLVTEFYIRWLRANAVRQDRPYRILRDSFGGYDFTPLGFAPPEPDRLRPTPPATTPGRTAPWTPGRQPVRPTGPVRPGGPEAVTSTSIDLGALMPSRPLDTEDRSRDHRFKFQWTIELIRPEEARQAEDSETKPAGQPSPFGAPGQPVSVTPSQRVGGQENQI